MHSLLDQFVRRHTVQSSDESSAARIAEALRIVKSRIVCPTSSIWVVAARHIVYVYRFLGIHCRSQCKQGANTDIT